MKSPYRNALPIDEQYRSPFDGSHRKAPALTPLMPASNSLLQCGGFFF